MIDWNDKVKRLLKSELIKRAVTNADLAMMLSDSGLEETKASIDSKISRGTFSAAFFMQCMAVIGCTKIEIEEYETNTMIAAEPSIDYNKSLKNGN